MRDHEFARTVACFTRRGAYATTISGEARRSEATIAFDAPASSRKIGMENRVGHQISRRDSACRTHHYSTRILFEGDAFDVSIISRRAFCFSILNTLFMAASPMHGLAVLRHRNFAFFLAARLLAAIAVQMLNVAVGWQVYALTGKTLDLGLIGLSQFAPFIALVLIAGQVADHFDRRLIIIVCHVVEMVCAVILLVLVNGTFHSLWPILAAMALFGGARAFRMPTSQAVLMNLVPLESFASAVAISSSGFHVAVIAGPTLGGLLYLLGPRVVYATAVALFLSALVLMAFTKSNQSTSKKGAPAWNTLWEGLRFVRSKPIVLGAISLDLFAVLFGGATALLPAYAQDVLHVGPHGLGLLRTAPGIGAAITAIVLAFRPMSRRVGYWMFGGVAVFGLATMAFGVSRSFGLSLAALTVLGASDMVSVYIRHLLVQMETPDTIRGRVSAVNAVFIGASNELGEFESGVTASWFGLVPAVVIGGFATLAVIGLWIWFFPILWRMNRFPDRMAKEEEVAEAP